jgi:hypothetical protein
MMWQNSSYKEISAHESLDIQEVISIPNYMI